MKTEYKGITFDGTPEESTAALRALGYEQRETPPISERPWVPKPIVWSGGQQDCAANVDWPVLMRV